MEHLKRFLEYIARGLAMDERYFTPTNVKFMHLIVGQVDTTNYPKLESFLCPISDTFAKAIVDRIGCNGRRISPYVNHAIGQWFDDAFGLDVGEAAVARTMKQVFWKDE